MRLNLRTWDPTDNVLATRTLLPHFARVFQIAQWKNIIMADYKMTGR